ncbi:MAG: single-stranded-DNA-specific exonuclease RecJ [Bacteroidetes bacterium]|nr:single-stranded-DNA-specific exonuclease RecJ [Bacteroidota bacterium]
MQLKKWQVRDVDDVAVQHLAEVLKIHPILCKLLVLRGVTDYNAAFRFFRPKLEHLHDPFLMKGMEAAVSRIEKAIEQDECILVYGDYDVDGTTAVALVYTFFSNIYDKIDCYQPDRYKEGYGVSTAGIDYAADNNIDLIIALDCGVKAVDKVAYAKSRGVDFIICDHHTPGETLPDAVAVLDPKQADCPYPYKELCGCGVGFKLAQAYTERHKLPEDQLYDLMDLLAISIAADIVPITGENRVMTYFGLQLINNRPRTSIDVILKSAQKTGNITVSDLVFVIAPRINAAGRIDHASYAVDLLLETDLDKARLKAGKINSDNTYRKELDAQITEDALTMIREDATTVDKRSTVVYDSEWHKGVIGIVASRLIEKHYKPTVVLTRSNGKVVGSARSVKGFDLYMALEACCETLIQFGGHKYAAGMTLREEDVPAFAKRFEAVVADTIKEESLVPVINVDAELEFSEISEKFYNIIMQLAPFGPGNPNPVFMTSDARDTGNSRIVKEDHLKLDVFKSGQRNMKGIAFQQAVKFDEICRKTQFDICYQLQLNEWNGYSNVEMMVKDLK